MRSPIVLLAGLALLAACSKPAPKTTVQQFMEGQVNPAGEFLFHSVQDVADSSGHHLKAPQTSADWQAVRDQIAVLQAAPDVLTAPGLKAAPPGFKSENPNVESDPAWIQKAMDANRADFNRRAYRLRDAANAVDQAAQAHDPLAMQQALDRVDKACESCHLHYFYPNDKRAQLQAKEDGITD
jgi:cytochrome c556